MAVGHRTSILPRIRLRRPRAHHHTECDALSPSPPEARGSGGPGDQLVAEVAAYLEQASTEAPCPPNDGGQSKGAILLPYGRSAASGCALDAVVELFAVHTAEVRVLHVQERALTRAGPVDREPYDDAVRFLRTTIAMLRRHGVNATGVLRVGYRDNLAGIILAEAATTEASVIVLGARPRNALTTAFVGSTSREIWRAASCPILLVRSG